jgi:hypothetical protein
MTFADIGISAPGSSAIRRSLKEVSNSRALIPATSRNSTFSHIARLVAYCCGCEMKKISPVSRFTANPTVAHGTNFLAVRSGTPRMKPRRRRSKKPAAPINRMRPRK